MQLHITGAFNAVGADLLSLRCPSCKQIGVFQPLGGDLQFADSGRPFQVGQRMCPNASCKAHIFVIRQNGRLVASYPPERIDFDSSRIPKSIIENFEEAITCHANQCFVAAAIMVRKTLEVLCSIQGASGSDLQQRIRALESKVVLPPELLTGLNDLRLLGNDAAHLTAKTFAEVSQEEVEVAIEFTKEVLKAIYQYSNLLERLQSLKNKKQAAESSAQK